MPENSHAFIYHRLRFTKQTIASMTVLYYLKVAFPEVADQRCSTKHVLLKKSAKFSGKNQC